MAIVGAVVAVAGTAFSVVQQQKAAGQQRKARRAQQRQQELKARRQRIRAVRQQQIASSQARAAAAGLGGLETSGFRGGQTALQANLGAGLGFSTQMSGLSRNISMFQQKAADAMGLARMGQAVSSLAMQGASLSMQMGRQPNQAEIPSLPSGGYNTSNLPAGGYSPRVGNSSFYAT